MSRKGERKRSTELKKAMTTENQEARGTDTYMWLQKQLQEGLGAGHSTTVSKQLQDSLIRSSFIISHLETKQWEVAVMTSGCSFFPIGTEQTERWIMNEAGGSQTELGVNLKKGQDLVFTYMTLSLNSLSQVSTCWLKYSFVMKHSTWTCN